MASLGAVKQWDQTWDLIVAGFDPVSVQSWMFTMAPDSTVPLRLGVLDFGEAIHYAGDACSEFVRALEVPQSLGYPRVDLSGPTFAPRCLRRAGLLLCEAELLGEHHRHQFSPMLASLMSYAEGKSAADLVQASHTVDQAQAQLQQWLTSCNVLVTPTTPQRAFAFAEAVPTNQADSTGYANFADNRALSVPMPVANRELPLALQLVGQIGDECSRPLWPTPFLRATDWSSRAPAACRSWWPQ